MRTVNQRNPFFKNKFTQFLVDNEAVSDDEFFSAYSKLPALSKQDYAEAGRDVMPEKLRAVDDRQAELQVNGNPLKSIARLRRSDYMMHMATGGSTSLPLAVRMTKQHMFSMLFTFFKCWYRMGWRPGQRMLVFYPKNTYNIDDMVKFNPYSKLLGFRYHLFDRIDEQTVRELIDDINSYKPKLLLVFPSPMNMVAHTVRKLGLKLNHHPDMINVSGETFFDCQRQNIESVFTRSKIEDSYGSVELGEIAHETSGGLEIFANVAYVETELNESGQPEMIITRLKLTDFPFIRYRMKDIAEVEFKRKADGTEKYVITKIEGKDSNYIMSDQGERFYPSFFNAFVNELNETVEGSVQEIKVYERGQTQLEIQFILGDDRYQLQVESETIRLLTEYMSAGMTYRVRFVDFIDHDYRRSTASLNALGMSSFPAAWWEMTKKPQ